MPKVSYPSEADLEITIRSLALFQPDALSAALELLDLEAFALAAARQWEEETDWIPFLADVDEDNPDETRYFDPPGPNTRPRIMGGGYNLSLDCGIVQLVTVHTGWAPTDDGTAALAGTDFHLWPYNANPLKRPWTELRFVVPQWGVAQSIRLVGRFGYAATVPDNAWTAILHYGVILALPEIAANITGGGNTEFQELGVTERFGPAFLTGSGSKDDTGLGGAWMREWERVRNLFRRVVV